MSQKIKLTTLSIFIFGMLLISGCGEKSSTSKIEVNSTNGGNQEIEKQIQEDGKNVPDNLNSILDSINSESQKENEIFANEESDSKKAVSDDGEANDFGAIYNENDF